MSTRSNRQSNIELLRIIAAFGVIILHYNNPVIGGGYAAAADGSLNQLIMTVLEAGMICAVNLYVLISGYFMRDSSKRDLLKPIELLTQFFVFELAFYLIKELPKGESFSAAVLMSYLTPSYWFVFVYIALYLISPYINAVWSHLDGRGKKIFLYIMLGLFSIYPIILEIIVNLTGSNIWGADMICIFGLKQGLSSIGLFGSQAGYSIVNFVLMYLIGCFIRDKEDAVRNVKTGKLVILLVLNIAAIVGWTYAERLITGNPLTDTTGWNYENPLVITEAILFFLIFKNINLKHNSVINRLAAASFPSYLIHINLLEYLRISDFVQGNAGLMTLHIIGSTIVIYMISFVIYEIYRLITKPLFRLVADRWQKNRFYSV